MKPNNEKGNTAFALVTGATSGIGYELARCLAADNYNLILVARTTESLEKVSGELSNQYHIQVETFACDLMSQGAAKEVYDHVKNLNHKVEILINDAGQGEWGKFTETELDREVDLVHLNVISLMGLTKFFLKDMVEQGRGKILQVASSLSKAPSPYMAVYGATKAFVYSFTEALIVELKDTGVSVTALMPGATDTDFFHKAGAEDSVEYKEADLYDPAEVAKAGYDGMMSGKDKVIPGFKNKMMGALGNILPDTAVASNMEKHMKPSEKQDGRSAITHTQSAEERERINNATGNNDGDFGEHADHVHESGR